VHPLLADIFGPDLIVVLIIVAVVLFGGSQIPKLARSLGSAQSEFKKGLSDGQSASSDTPAPPAGPAAGSDGGPTPTPGGPTPAPGGPTPAPGGPPSS
jgi:sec-independent protein translocase protein TatA